MHTSLTESDKRAGWEEIRIGNRVILHNRWTGQREVAQVITLSEKPTKFPDSWRREPADE